MILFLAVITAHAHDKVIIFINYFPEYNAKNKAFLNISLTRSDLLFIGYVCMYIYFSFDIIENNLAEEMLRIRTPLFGTLLVFYRKEYPIEIIRE